MKVGDVCLFTCAIHGLGLANNSRIRIIAIHRYYVEVVTIGEYRERNVRIPRISFRFRLPYEKSYQLTRLQFPLRLAYAMTYNKSQSQTLSKVLLDIVIGHGIGGNIIPAKMACLAKRPDAGVSDDRLVCHHPILRPLKLMMALRSKYVDATCYADIIPIPK